MRRFSLVLATLATTLCLAGPAQAESFLVDSTTHTRAPTVDVFLPLDGLLFGSYTHYGLGAWYGHPIAPDGFIGALNDAFYIEAGAAIERYSWSYGWGTKCDVSWWRVSPMGGIRWDFHITPKFTAFLNAKLGYGIGLGENVDCGGVKVTTASSTSYSEFKYIGSVGGYYKFSDTWALRFDLGNFDAIGIGTTL